MISNVAYDTQAHELALLLEIFHDEAARLTQEQWQMAFFSEEDAFAAFIKDDPLVDMACMEAAGDEGVALIERFREKYADAFLMVIADASVSPVKYIKPSIMPGSLLLRPAGAVQSQLRGVYPGLFAKDRPWAGQKCVCGGKPGRTGQSSLRADQLF